MECPSPKRKKELHPAKKDDLLGLLRRLGFPLSSFNGSLLSRPLPNLGGGLSQ